MTSVKEDPVITKKLAAKLVVAKDDNDVAEAIEEAKTELIIKKMVDPVKIKLVKEEAKIAVVVRRNDMKTK